MFPQKLYVEITTRCNMRCGMCVKHVPGSQISNEDMDFDVYKKLIPSFPKIRELILNGLGEPLLHPDLLRMLETARQHMTPGSVRGFQSNGLLLNETKVEELIQAGLNLLCISVDSCADQQHTTDGLLHNQLTSSSPLAMADAVRKKSSSQDFRLGAEIVLTRETLHELPELVESIARQGADFIIGTHLLSYTPESQSSSLFDTNTLAARKIYKKHKELSSRDGINLSTLTGKTWIAPRADKDHQLKHRFNTMLKEARQQDIWLHIKHLEAFDEHITREAEEAYELSYDIARRYNIDLDLPPLLASRTRSCRFIKDRTVFIDTRGNVMPCHALWHNYTLYMNGKPKHLHSRTFGSITAMDLGEICSDPSFTNFRSHADSNDFPHCHSCSPGPCPDITGEAGPFINDCFGIPVPCGHCLWCYDAVRCL